MLHAAVDFVAVGRVAKRTEFKSIRMTESTAKCDPLVSAPLEPDVKVECAVGRHEGAVLDVLCSCGFVAKTSETVVVEATVKYLLTYEIQGAEPLAETDIAEFAAANGVLHSWPFVREWLYGLTSRMGYPAFALPLFHFVPKQQEKKEATGKPKAQQPQPAPEK